MKRTFRSVLSCILCAMILCTGMAPAQVRLPLTITVDAADLTYGDYTYTVSGSNATITKYNGTASTVSIPSKIGSYTVTTIGWNAFRDNKTLISVSIPATVVAIGTGSNSNEGAFQNCTKLQTVSIIKGTKDAYVGKDAFAGCASLQSITVPGNYTTIRSGAFYGCISLKSATFEKSASSSANQTIEGKAFQGCSSLTELSLPTTLKSIGNNAFRSCTSLKNLTIPEGVVTIEYEAFRNDSALLSVSIPSTVTIIGTGSNSNEGAFQDCAKLQTVTIAKGTKDAIIGKDAFAGCFSLQSITIPGNYATVRSGAFYGCSALTSVIYEQSDYIYANQTIEDKAFQGCSSLTELSLPTTLKSIGNNAFRSCTSLKNLTIPEGVVTIEYEAFCNNSELLSVSIPSTVTIIGTGSNSNEGAFQDCTKLQTVTIAKGTKDAIIGKDAFAGCTSLKSISIPGNYSVIRSGAFYKCTSLTSVIYEQSDYVYANQSIDRIAFQGCSSLTELSLPTTLKSIGNNAFRSCTSLKNLTIPEGVVTIEYEAFRNNSELLSVSIPSTVTIIGTGSNSNEGAFQDCTKLQTVTIAKGTKDATIGKDAFKGCVALTTVHIPSNVTSILSGAFTNCGNVTICNTTSDCHAKTYADANKIPFRICSGHAASVSYTVTLNANGGSVSPASFTVNSGNSITLPTPTRSGYTCLGWSTSSSASSASYACGASYRPTASVTLYAVWQQNSVPVTTYTVTLNANGGSVSPASFTVISGNSVTLPTPTRSGYTCLGWSTSSSASSASYACGASYRPTASVTLYAVWQKNSTTTYTVTLNAAGGSVSPSSFTVNSGDSITLPTPTRSGYTCLGWSASVPAYTYYACGTSYCPTANVTLYAVWSQDNPVVTETLTLSTDAVTVKVGESVTFTCTRSAAYCGVNSYREDDTIFVGSLGEWANNTATYKVTGLSAGTSRLKLELVDLSNGAVLDTKTVTVTVTDDGEDDTQESGWKKALDKFVAVLQKAFQGFVVLAKFIQKLIEIILKGIS